MAETTLPTSELGFDKVLKQLQDIVDRLEQGNLSLEAALAAYEQAIGLARRGHEVLDSAEKRIELLVRRDGCDVAVPFDDEDDSHRA